ncbi:MAG TPA: PGPGW domain-containing protein [Chthoniobacterales bacterium]|nr:PGPGW domain-containing protein [Chthoniobacterales bacterium]
MDSVGLRNWPIARKIVVSVIGGTVVLVGMVLLIMPGPAMVVIPVGLLILASEFAWARWLLKRGKKVVKQAKAKIRDGVESVRPS